MFPLNQIKDRGSARSQIGVKEVRDNILVLPGNRYRAVLVTSSVNFELQSEAEQDALIDNFQAFLNSLTTPIQILIRIRELDIKQYLENLTSARAKEEKTIYRNQLKYYSNFIRKLVSGNKILSRRFYIIIPYENRAASDFNLAKEQLMLEQEIIIKGLAKLGMKVNPLKSLEVLDLFYSFYNPELAKTQPLTELILRKSNELNII